MNGARRTGVGRGADRPRTPPFGLDEMRGAERSAATSEDQAALEVGRRLEASLGGPASGSSVPSSDFTARVMAAVAAEPAPAPATALGAALRRRKLGRVPRLIDDARRVLVGASRPLIARSQAAVVLVVALLLAGSVSTLAVAGARMAFSGPEASVPPVPPSLETSPAPSRAPSPLPSSAPSSAPIGPPSTEPSGTATPSGSREVTDPEATSGPSGVGEPATPTPGGTDRPGETGVSAETEPPDATHSASIPASSGVGAEGEERSGAATPGPGETPRPIGTPSASAPGDGHGT